MRFALTALAACVVTTSLANAEIISDPRQIKAGSPIAKYLASSEVRKTLIDVAVRLDRAFGIECIGDYQIKLETLTIQSPINLPDGAAHAASGAWRLGYDATRCGEIKRYNVQFAAKPGTAPEPGMLAPGSSIASFQLYADAMTGSYVVASARLGGCKEARLFHTTLTKAPHAETEGDKVRNGVWNEDWTFAGCGKRVVLPMKFTPAPDGGTIWSIGK